MSSRATVAAATAAAPTPLPVVAGLAVAPLVALGLARFAYALLLPPMRADLGWSYAEAGAMNAANALGYLAGALLAAPLAARLGPRRAFAGGTALTALAVFATGLTASFPALLALRAVAGLAGGVAFVAGGGLAAAAGAGGPERAARVLGLYAGGAGAGVVLSALAVPPVLAAAGWEAGWLALGLLSALALAAALPALARAPLPVATGAGGKGAGHDWPLRALAPTLGAYGLFGAGYIAYATFVVAHLRATGLGDGEVAVFWAILGTAGIAGAFAWTPVLARQRGWRGPTATLAVTLAGAALPVAFDGIVVAFASAILFGGAFLAVIAAVTGVARRLAPPAAWMRAVGALTVCFALGQVVGPVLTGAVSDGAGAVRAGLALSAVILLVAAVLATRQRAEVGD